jgi:hypothetical protein
MLVMYLLPLVALSIDSNQVGVNYPDFIVRIFPVWIFITGTVLWCGKQRWLRPREAKVLSWEGALFLFARWPWSLLGTISAVVDWLRGRILDFRVTPKGRGDAKPLPLRVLAPYAFLSITSGLPVLLLGNIKIAVGSVDGHHRHAQARKPSWHRYGQRRRPSSQRDQLGTHLFALVTRAHQLNARFVNV